MSEMLLTTYNGVILGPIAKLLGWIMSGIYYVMELIGIQNVGLTTILFTIVFYLFLFPLTYKQQKFSKLSQKMQPELQAIQKKYAGKKDQQSMMNQQAETQAVYEKYGVSMIGSCGQLLIQMPLVLALYRVFMNVPAYISRVKAEFIPLTDAITATDGYQDKMAAIVEQFRIVGSTKIDFTATDTTALYNNVIDVLNKLNSSGWDALRDSFPSLGDTISSTYESVSHLNTFLCFNISDTPWGIISTSMANHAYLLAFAALLIPVISYLTQVLNIKLMPQTPSSPAGEKNEQADAMANQMKMMNKIMPLFSLIFCFTVPVGLGIYWIASAVARAVQQFFLNKHFDKIDLDDIIKKNQEKARKKREKMGISENQIYNAARMNTKNIDSPAKKQMTSAEKELELEKANAKKSSSKAGSMAAKANMVKDFNERNTRK